LGGGGAWRCSNGADMVIRDEEGEIIQSACSQLTGCADALKAETLACLHGFMMP
jgi:hypothetical protein